MLQILRQYEEGNFIVTEWTKNGVDISHIVREVKPSEMVPEDVEPV